MFERHIYYFAISNDHGLTIPDPHKSTLLTKFTLTIVKVELAMVAP